MMGQTAKRTGGARTTRTFEIANFVSRTCTSALTDCARAATTGQSVAGTTKPDRDPHTARTEVPRDKMTDLLKMRYFLALSACVALTAAACGSSSTPAPGTSPDASQTDAVIDDADATSGQDTAADSGKPDTTSDSLTDTAVADMAIGDTALGETADGDTLAGETAGETTNTDVTPNDTAAADVSALDSANTADSAAQDTKATDASVADSADTASPDAIAIKGEAQLVGAGWSFGECMGQCKGDAVFGGAAVTLTISGWDKTVYSEAKGYLTTGASAAIQDLESKLTGSLLEPVYGCPDCADGGSAWIVLSHDGTASKHTYEFGKPPAVLKGFDAIVAPALAGLKACKGDAIIVVSSPCPNPAP